MTLNDLNAIPFYDSLSKQKHRQWYAYNKIFPLITPLSKMLPFQVRRPATNAPLTSFDLYNMDTGVTTDIFSEITAAGLNVYNHGGENYSYTGSVEQDPGIDNVRSWGFSIGQYAALRYLQCYIQRVTEVPPSSATEWFVRFVLFDGKDGTQIGSHTFESVPNVWSPSNPTSFIADFGEIIETNGTDVLWLEVRSNLAINLLGRDDATLTFTPEQERYGTSDNLNLPPDTNIGTPGDYDAHVRVWGGVYDYDLIIYPGLLSYDYDTPIGRYYAIMGDGTNTWYSEVFNIVPDISSYLKITYWHRYDFIYEYGNQQTFIRYLDDDGNNMYKSIIYLETDIARPEYKFEDEVSVRMSKKMKIHQTSWKELRFDILAPEYLLDAMRVINMHHDVEIYYQGDTYTIDDITFEAEWIGYGDIAKVQFTLHTDTVITQNGDNVAPLPTATPLGQWAQPDGQLWQNPDGDGWIYG